MLSTAGPRPDRRLRRARGAGRKGPGPRSPRRRDPLPPGRREGLEPRRRPGRARPARDRRPARRGRQPRLHLLHRGRPRRQGRPDPRPAALRRRRRAGSRRRHGRRPARLHGIALKRTPLVRDRGRHHRGRILLMFTGIISHRGRFRGYRKGRSEMAVEAPGLAAKLQAGDSVAVNGVCLTLAGTDRDALRFDLSRRDPGQDRRSARSSPGDAPQPRAAPDARRPARRPPRQRPRRRRREGRPA